MPVKLRLKLANECSDLISKASLESKSDKYIFHLVHSRDVSNETFSKLMDLFVPLMSSFYESSSWGWDQEKKLDEWRNPKTRMIIVTERGSDTESSTWKRHSPPVNARIIAFMCFRFEVGADKNETALYVYELHVDQEFQRKGLGKQLMKIANHLAKSLQMNKTMLTVFRANKQALDFYKKLKFSPDKSSPEHNEADYVIMSERFSNIRR